MYLHPKGITPDEIELLENLQKKTPMKELIRKYGSRNAVNYAKRNLAIKYGMNFRLHLNHSRILPSYHVWSEHQFDSPFLVSQCPLFSRAGRTDYLSRFLIPPALEGEFMKVMTALDGFVEVYKSEELSPPTYNFKVLLYPREYFRRILHWENSLESGKFPSLETDLVERSPITLDARSLQTLQYRARGLSKMQVIKKLRIDRRDYNEQEATLSELGDEVIDVPEIKKLLIFLSDTGRIDGKVLIKSFLETYVYCYPFQVKKLHPKPDGMGLGYLCFICPPSPNIPEYHPRLDSFLKVNSNLIAMKFERDLCNLYYAFDPSTRSWSWNDESIKLLR